MYLNHFNLKREPFHITPDPYFFYLSPSHKEAFAAMIYGLKKRKGFVAVIGEVGLGKTTVLRTFIEQRGARNQIKTVFVFNSNVSFKGLLKVIYGELGYSLPISESFDDDVNHLLQGIGDGSSPSDEIFELVHHLHTKLIQEYQQGNNIVLVIDEAQNMPVGTLENLRMLSNLETAQDKLIQIFLIGQPELESTLNKKELRQLKQRIALRSILKPLTKAETIDYIHHRLTKAGAEDVNIFTRSALKTIYKLSNGSPRRINILCDNGLVTGFGYGKKSINAKIIKEVNEDLEGRAFHPKKKRLALKACAFVVGLIVVGLSLLLIPPVKEKALDFAHSTPILNKGLVLIKQWADFGSGSTNTPQSENIEPKPPSTGPFNSTDPEDPPIQHPETLAEDPAPVVPELQAHLTSNTTVASSNATFESPALETAEHQPVDANTTATNSSNMTGPSPRAASANATEPPGGMRAQVDSTQESADTQPPEIDYETLFIKTRLKEALPFYSELSRVRQQVLIAMAKQTSIKGLLTFKNMIAALEKQNFRQAAREMVYSQWAGQVGTKAYELAHVMRTGDEADLQKWLEGE